MIHEYVDCYLGIVLDIIDDEIGDNPDSRLLSIKRKIEHLKNTWYLDEASNN
jgi:hypothetical protein